MKNLKLIIVAMLSFLFIITCLPKSLPAQDVRAKLETIRNPTFYDIKKIYDEYWNAIPPENRRGWKQYQRWVAFWEPRVYPDGVFPDATNILTDWRQFAKKAKNSTLSANLQWQLLGPVNVPPDIAGVNDVGIGRVNVIRFNPNNNNEIWIGAATGGVWKSTNNGSTWTTFPFTQFLSLGVSDIAISQSNPNVIYVATGDSDGSLGTAQSFYAVGIIKTTDGGQNWDITSLSYSMDQAKVISKVLVNPSNPDIVLAATNDGIYKTTNGGLNWVVKKGGYNFKDMKFNPADPNKIVATNFSYNGNASFWKSNDMGETWTQVQTETNCLRISLAVSPEDPNIVYALACTLASSFHSFQMSTDGGNTWNIQATPSTVGNLLGWQKGTGSDAGSGQGPYDLSIAIVPSDITTIFIGGIDIWESNDGGVDWNLNTHWYGAYNKPYVHADIHDLIFHGNRLFSGNDGGIVYSDDGGDTWTNISNGLSITQFYRLGLSGNAAYEVFAGCQDNGSFRYTSQNNDWRHVYSSDGMEAAVDPTNPQRCYVSIYNGSLYYSTNGGVNFNVMLSSDQTHETGAWTTPYVVDPQQPAEILAAYQNVWKSTNYGTGGNWTKISDITPSAVMHSLAVAPSDANYIYVADYSRLFKTSGGGGTNGFQQIYTSSGASKSISYICVHPTNPNKIWVSFSGYDATTKVMEYDGTTWKNITGNLPNVPVNTIVYQANSPDRLYVGTDIGVFYSDYNSSYWLPFGNGLPNVIINELEIHPSTSQLFAATYGRGIWVTDLLDCNLAAPTVTVTGSTTICQGDSVTLTLDGSYPGYYWSNGATTKSITVGLAGSYSAIISDGTCTAKSTSVDVSVIAVPQLTITPSGKFPLCVGDSGALVANFGFTKYYWSTGDSTRRITVKNAGTYSLTVTTSDGCTTKDSFVVVIDPPPAVPTISRSVNYLVSSPATSYQWILNDADIPGATSQSYLVKAVGIYRVKIGDANGCQSISEPFDVTTAVEETVLPGDLLSVHPNPSSGDFNMTLNLPENTKFEVMVTNETGDVVARFQGQMESNTYTRTIELKNLPIGMYNLTVWYDNRKIVEKLIKN
jgi:photosystem II stability/assembly factor-like uncharacterized protein